MSFLAYAALYHIVLMLIGLATIVMGYRLFVLGVMPQQGSDVDAQAGKVRLNIKNAAPGTIFCVLGSALILYMIHQGPPKQEINVKTPNGTEYTTTTRGNNESLERTLVQAKDLLVSGDTDDAFVALLDVFTDSELTLHQALPVFTAMAQAQFQAGRFNQAATYAQLAVEIDDSYVEALVIYAKTLKALNETEQAMDIMQNAADIDGQYHSILRDWNNELNR
ncbi:tetratricopeptide repeat protein [Sessilibacter corallicola]|uniref:tetratricopeptide repeat protein n=1 Tax=Sessilibacter corallicola TaxID=2904075 RepID=UPI001E541CE8|nr:hypothetical protein [Sessilibacter corallicola]MCE2029790.1 hypothetical protein [Sessilibacter corallicola]